MLYSSVELLLRFRCEARTNNNEEGASIVGGRFRSPYEGAAGARGAQDSKISRRPAQPHSPSLPPQFFCSHPILLFVNAPRMR